MDKHLRQQNPPEPLNRSLVLPVTSPLHSQMSQQCEDVWRKRKGGLNFCVLKGFLLQAPCWGPGSRGEELTCSGCPFAGTQGRREGCTPSSRGMCRLPCQAIHSPSHAHPQCQRITFYLLIFHIPHPNFHILPMTFQFIEAHTVTCGAPRVCA